MDSQVKILKNEFDDYSTKCGTTPSPGITTKSYEAKFESDKKIARKNTEITASTTFYMASTHEFMKDSVLIDNVEIFSNADTNLAWIANKCSSIGRVDTMEDYFELVTGKCDEDCQSVVLTFKTINELNEKINQLDT